MNLSHTLVVVTFKALTSLVSYLDVAELARVPPHGPLIIYTNHVNLLEIPVIYTRLQPRKVHGMIAAERWNIPVLSWMLDVTETIPLHRGEADIDAIHQALKALKRGAIIIISPEGTRSHDGFLQPAHPGVVLLALHSHATLLPVAYYGAESWKEKLAHLKRIDFHLRVGRPFHLDDKGARVTRAAREQIMDEMMFQLAQILPPQYRGYYVKVSPTTDSYLVFEK